MDERESIENDARPKQGDAQGHARAMRELARQLLRGGSDAQRRRQLVRRQVDDRAQVQLLQKWEIELVRLRRAIEVLLDHAIVLRRDEGAHGWTAVGLHSAACQRRPASDRT